MKCGRCKKIVLPNEDETCWYCLDTLCYDCWDKYGHCGHPEADKMNEEARKVKQPETRKFEIFQDGEYWYFEAYSNIHGPFENKTEAKLAQDTHISEYYLEDD